jgi:hypothetical protein
VDLTFSHLGQLVGEALAEALGSQRGRDRRLLREGRARCGVRAVRGRVLDIGTEWSAGTCTISPGRILFSPTIGIVGDRDIPVLELLSSEVDPDEHVYLSFERTVTYVVRTAKGDLYWGLPDHVAERASALLFAPAEPSDPRNGHEGGVLG